MAWVDPSTVVTGDVLTASKWNQDVVENTTSLARGYVAHATKTTNTSYSGPTDVITGVSASLVSGRRYRVTAHVNFHAGGASLSRLQVYRGATVIATGNGYCQSGINEQGCITVVAYIAPSTATETFKIDIQVTAGNATGTAVASATQPALLLIEDIGAV
jgi:hypothetical protein